MFNLAEFKRNLWLEFSVQRLMLMPLILSGILFLAHRMYEDDAAKEYSAGMQSVITSLFVLMVVVWGTRQVSRSMNDELSQRTWDFQRMSSLSGLDMLLGKLFGSTSYSWFGGLLLLGAYIGFDVHAHTPAYDIFVGATQFLLIGIFTHATILMFALLMLRNTAFRHKPRGSLFYTMLVFALIAPVFIASSLLNMIKSIGTVDESVTDIDWYSFTIAAPDFLLLTLLAFTIWALLGAYRMIASELQYRQIAFGWPLFLLFLCAYASGFTMPADFSDGALGKISPYMIITMAVASCSVYLCLFFEPIDSARYHTLLHVLRREEWRRFYEYFPWWLSSFLLFLLANLYALGESLVQQRDPLNALWLSATTLCFMLRDIGLVHLLSFTGTRRVRGAFLVYMAVLYTLLPGLCYELQWHKAVAAFILSPDHKAISLIAVALQVALVAALCLWRWQKLRALKTA